jgi:hypothetical protein
MTKIRKLGKKAYKGIPVMVYNLKVCEQVPILSEELLRTEDKLVSRWRTTWFFW